MRLPVRKPIAGRRRRRATGRSPLLNWSRLAGLALMAAAAGAFAWLTQAEEFRLDSQQISVSGLHYTDAELVVSLVGPWLDGRPNLFRLPASDVERALLELPAVAGSEVRLTLPGSLSISLVERVPVFVWQTDGGAFLVDSEGVLLRGVAEGEQPRGELPRLEDRRQLPEPPAVGSVLAEADRLAVLKLAAVDPALVGSRAARLALSVDDEEGYSLIAEPGLWRAVFGHYTPTLRRPEIIDRQVQCLRSLLAAEDEGQLEAIFLAPADDRCGTFRMKQQAARASTRM
jgi:cell division septal protein FtsQ